MCDTFVVFCNISNNSENDTCAELTCAAKNWLLMISLPEQHSNIHLAKIPTVLFLFDNIDDDRNASGT